MAIAGMSMRTHQRWYLLPLLAVTVLISSAALLELVARAIFTESSAASHPCLIMNDPVTGVRGKPNTVCAQKTRESQWAEYRFNSCGHRAAMECNATKPPGTYRIVLVGSSLSEGWTVSREQSYAAILPGLLTARTGRKVELYNEGMEWGSPRNVDARFDEVLAAKPDLILWPVTPWDIHNVNLAIPASKSETRTQHAEGGGANNDIASLASEIGSGRALGRSFPEPFGSLLYAPTSSLQEREYLPSAFGHHDRPIYPFDEGSS